MAEFLYGIELNNEINQLIRDAELSLILISPYIKLHPDLKDELKFKVNRNDLDVIVVFGKNEEEAYKSLALDEIEFFKSFPNLEIRYEKRLHAKYYANEEFSILSSMNLYEYSLNNNIEFGILSNRKDSLDKESITYFKKVIKGGKLVYKQEAIFEKKLGGLKSVFKGINVIEDNIHLFYNEVQRGKTNPNPLKSTSIKRIGYCIRTGVEIPFNPKMPFSRKAYQSWLQYKNETYIEKYCHFSGEESGGKTSFKYPILRKNWTEASKFI